MTKEEKIIDKVKKLLSLSRSANENEAAAAAARAHELMLKYRIDKAALKEERKESSVIEFTLGDETRPYAWRMHLINGLAEAFGCEFYYIDVHGKSHIGPRKARFILIGLEEQKNAIQYLHDYLVKDINRLANKAWKAEVKAYNESAVDFNDRPSAHGWKLSFRLGAATMIAERVVKQYKKIINETKKDKEKSQALVLIKEDEAKIQAFYEDVRKRLKLRKSSQTGGQVVRSGYDAGQEAGEQVQISTDKSLEAPKKQIKGKQKKGK